ncbi:MAG TPA: hypothetical protein VK890_06300, partial [Bacteroidia bacterium]|nr:hypothetical protein [Bacteroidia bacterium]
MFLQEFQTEYGQWVWGRRKDLVGQSTWKWIMDHPEDFVVSMYIKIDTFDNKKIFTGDIIRRSEDDNHTMVGVIEFVEGGFA